MEPGNTEPMSGKEYDRLKRSELRIKKRKADRKKQRTNRKKGRVLNAR